ncbi:MAG TPA: 2-oxo acid dehydrogenase subunit E2, partial [Thermoanaerobaculia bacterium]|nr:2-oxo acid dehydrogenase subunit E2 [Thermoanaerobaculia bacterium]
VLAEIATEDAPAGAADGLLSAPAPAAGNFAARLGVDLASMPTRGSQPAATEVREAHETRDGGRSRRITIARRLTAAAAVPTVTNVWEVDFEAVLSTGTRPLTAVAHATVVALSEQRTLNAWGEADGGVREHEEVHLGIATQGPQSLVVPVVHNAQLMSAGELEAAIATVTTAAREGRARPDELSGSTFTITSAGRLAGEFATPLLNLPEVAILGLYRVHPRAVAVDGEVAVRQRANLSIGFDHRAVDGLAAATFLARVAELVSSWPIGEEAGDA